MHFSWWRQKRKPSALWAPGAGDTLGACTYKSHQSLVEECADGNNFLTALPAFGTDMKTAGSGKLAGMRGSTQSMGRCRGRWLWLLIYVSSLLSVLIFANIIGTDGATLLFQFAFLDYKWWEASFDAQKSFLPLLLWSVCLTPFLFTYSVLFILLMTSVSVMSCKSFPVCHLSFLFNFFLFALQKI